MPDIREAVIEIRFIAKQAILYRAKQIALGRRYSKHLQRFVLSRSAVSKVNGGRGGLASIKVCW